MQSVYAFCAGEAGDGVLDGVGNLEGVIDAVIFDGVGDFDGVIAVVGALVTVVAGFGVV